MNIGCQGVVKDAFVNLERKIGSIEIPVDTLNIATTDSFFQKGLCFTSVGIEILDF